MGVTTEERKSLLTRATRLKAAYPRSLRMSGVRLQRSLDCSVITIIRLRRSRAAIARSYACLAALTRQQAQRPMGRLGKLA